MFALCGTTAFAEPIGQFEAQTEIGSPKLAGSARFEAVVDTYTISGGGQNMWSTNDSLHFVWKKMSGDAALTAGMKFQGAKGDPHRKACLIFRQSLDADSAYADAAFHGDGLTSLQYRPAKGDRTYEVQAGVSAPSRVMIERRGRYVSMFVASESGKMVPAGGAFRLDMEEPFYVGLGVCAHNNEALETATFSNVTITTPEPLGPKPKIISTLEKVAIASKDRRAVLTVVENSERLEAPNWSKDGKLIYFKSGPVLKQVSATGGNPSILPTGLATRCNGDHVLSPDGTSMAISDESQGDKSSRIYILPLAGGEPRLLTTRGPSYCHGWSPDGSLITYCGVRAGRHFICTIRTAGGEEKRLTTGDAYDDGPDFSADGKSIYFCSDRTGSVQIWKTDLNGAETVQITHDDLNNWYPHPSPDGKWLLFVTYDKGVKGHAANQDVSLRIMPAGGGRIDLLARLLGGQGTLTVPSWSPDSRSVAFVSYQWSP